MLQLYFLIIFCDAVSGIALLGAARGGTPFLSGKNRFALGIVTVLVALLTLVSPVESDIPVLGDLFPALAGLAAGFTLLYDSLSPERGTEAPASVIAVLVSANRGRLGFLSITAAALHFLLPAAVII
jgi:hypothetical protein